jgi:GntR family transcriptional regulator, carbon starvation induced regulator
MTLPMSRKSTETLASSAYERLRVDLISGAFEPGSKLLIRELCQRYGIGLSPMREALNRVSRDGLVQQNDQRGFFASPLSEEDLDDLFKMRCWSNEKALRDSIEKGDQAWEEHVLIAFYRLSRIPNPVEHADKPIDPVWERNHRTFHTALISACGSKRLVGLCEELFDAAERYRFLSRRISTGLDRRQEEHHDIMQATLRRDADEATRLLTQHFLRTLEYSRAEIRQLNEGTAKARKVSVSAV